MYTIDEIMKMLDSGNAVEIQEQGCYLAREIKCINVFLQPLAPYGKRVWENCAKILCEKSDEELSCYFYDLLKWLQDMNWPGADLIFNRLVKCKSEHFDFVFKTATEKSALLNDDVWSCALNELKTDREKNSIE